MGGIGRCCCACECFPVEDLPTVTISGYTGAGWTGNCCFQQVFTPNTTPPWVKRCSGKLYEFSSSQQCVTHHHAILSPDYRGFEVGPGDPCETRPDGYCCPAGSEHVATTNTNWEFIDNEFMAAWIRHTSITVRISQEQVDCEGVEGETGGCKIVVRSRYAYESVSSLFANRTEQADQSVTLESADCFEVNPKFIVDLNPSPEVTCETIPSDPNEVAFENCRAEADFGFDRVKYYDEMPSGPVEFTNEDVPGCDSTSCDYEPYAYVNQICIYGPTEEINALDPDPPFPCLFILPCECFNGVYRNDFVSSFPDLSCDLSVVNSIAGCFSDPCVIPNCANEIVTFCGNPGDPVETYDCPEVLAPTAFSYGCNSPDALQRRIFAPESGCLPFLGDESTAITYSGCGCNNAASGGLPDEFPYLDTSDCFEGNCNPNCCREFDDCPCCGPVCKPLYIGNIGMIQSHSLTQTCTGLQSASVCINAPSWTINLA